MRWRAVKAGAELEFEDRWIPYYLPHWSTRERSAAGYAVGGGCAGERPALHPPYGLFEMRAKATDDPLAMVALWMIGYEDEPDRSGEICICEIFGRDVGADRAAVGMGVHPFGDPRLVDEFSAETVPIDAREFHVCAAEWTPERVAFFVDDRLVKTVHQSPSYPMQLMLSIYEFPGDADGERSTMPYPKQFTVDYVRGYRLA